mgnify:CR=1 FL=1
MRLYFEEYILDTSRRELVHGGEVISVEPKVFDLLLYLIENRNRLVTKDDLIAHVWCGRIVSDSALTSAINAARKALRDNGRDQRLIRTSARKGFRFVGDVRTQTAGTELLSATPEDAAAPALPDKPSIAVLPFTNMTTDSARQYLADGIVESLTSTLSRIRSFFVVARASAFTFRGRTINVRDVGRELGVGYIVEGSVQHNGSRLRISVQLIETGKGANLWAEKYDGSTDDIFDFQDQIAEQVAGAIQPSIRLAEIERARRKRPQDLNAYDLAMQAMRHVWLLDRSEADLGLKLLEQAIQLDPEYPLALALAAWCWAQRSVYNWTDDISEAIAQALRLADLAARQSTDDPLILTVLGAVHTFARNFGVARILLERAVALDPNAAWAYSRLGWLDVYADRPNEAKIHFEKALRLSPLDPVNFNNYVGLAAARTVAGDDIGTVNLLTRALQEQPGAIWIHRTLAAALYGAGRHDEALVSRDIALKAHPGLTVAKFREAMVFSPKTLNRISEQLLALEVPKA